MIAILTYHSLDLNGSVLSVSPDDFAAHLRLLAERGVPVVPLDEVPRLLAEGGDGKPCVAITFDDGFESVFRHALPVLHQHGFPATIFLATGYCGRTNAWTGQHKGIPERRLLRWSNVRAMSAAGLKFGSHTRTHPDLTSCPTPAAVEEMVTSKRAIEDATGRPVDAFAYPYGIHDPRIRALARAHFQLACTATLDVATPGSDPFALERLDMYYLRRPALFRHLFTRPLDAYLRLRRVGRSLRARTTRSTGGET